MDTNLDELRADMDAKKQTYDTAKAAYAAAVCATNPIQPGDTVQWTRYAGEIERGQVTRLEWMGYKTRIYAKRFLKSGALGAIESDIDWYKPTKVQP